MKPKEVEVALSVAMAEWFVGQYPDKDIETTPLSELGDDDAGILLTVEDEEFRILVEKTS